MSSATPAAFLSAISMTTTSASCLSATPRATVAPTLPAPPTTVTLRFIRVSSNSITFHHEDTKETRRPLSFLVQSQFVSFVAFSWLRDVQASELHLRDDGVSEIRRRQLGRAVHEPGEVVRDALG